MTYLVLIKFVNHDESFRSQLSSEQIKSVRAWARKVPVNEQLGHLGYLKKLSGKRLRLYLGSIVPEFHAE